MLATTQVPTTKAAPATEAPLTSPQISLQFSLTRIFTSSLSNSSSPEFQELESTSTITTAAPTTAVTTASTTAVATTVTPAAVTTTTVTPAVVTTTTVAPAVVTTTTVVPAVVTTTTVAPAVVTTTTVAPAAVTTTAVASTDPPSSSEGTLSLRFSLDQTFTSDLANSSSSAFKALAGRVVSELNNVYKAKFGASFIRTVVNSFRSGSIVVDSTLIFNNISSVPNNSLAAQTLQNAITFNTSGLTLPVNSSSIVVTRTSTITTAAPTTAVTTASTTAVATTVTPAAVTTTTVTPAVVTTTTVAPAVVTTTTVVPAVVTTTTVAPAVVTTTTVAPAAVTTTAVASTDPPSSSEGTLSLRFSLDQTFTSDLANSSSSAFKALAGRVVSEVNRIYASTPNFLRSIVNSFTSGSVVTKMTLVFRNQTSVPNASSALATFSNSSTSLSIVSGSVTVESSVNSGSAPGPTTFCLAALPLTLALLMIQLLSS
ncbi:mucin-5AC [Coregonus clupeaformis]|uniref:mucin-5AC n=1 Tax=Coregonus clupeaformis TaxID=59861 RepID=UPI001E1C3F71|nr:mucin-5AC [Coregonus clupeaformis]